MTSNMARTEASKTEYRRLQQQWKMLGDEKTYTATEDDLADSIHTSTTSTSSHREKAKKSIKSLGPAYRKFHSVVVGLAG